MRIVLAGGTGLIGRPLVAHLLESGHEVVVLGRNPDKSRALLPPAATTVAWDGQTAGDWHAALNGAGAVVNLAGESLTGTSFLPTRLTAARKQRVMDSRRQSTAALIEAIQAVTAKPAAFVQGAAVGYYGARGDDFISEVEPPGDDFFARVQVETESAAEPLESLGLRLVLVRSGVLLTPDPGGALARLVLPYKLFGGVYFGSGRQYFSWVHPADEVDAIRFLIESEAAAGPFNLTAPNPVTNREFGRALGRALNRPSYMPVPGFALKLLVGEVADTLLTGQRVLPQRLQELGFRFRYPEIEPALRQVLGR